MAAGDGARSATIGYYPGCALHGSSNDYEASVRASLAALDTALRDVDDWICCGASAAHALNHRLATALPARNLALAERDGLTEVLAPCPLCSMALLRAQDQLRQDAGLRQAMSAIVELPVAGSARVLNLIQVFQRIGFDRIKAAAKRPLAGVKPACYYGCLLTRPGAGERFDDVEHPTSMETLLAALGAEPVAWNYQTECCGAGLTLADEETVLDLSHKILSNAATHGATCLVVACPMCHVNLDMKQAAIEARHGARHGLPVYYLSDLVGRALGLNDSALGVDRHFVHALGGASQPAVVPP